jgi:hypothetical protein
MKSYLIVFCTCLVFISCKKDRDCNCTVNVSGTKLTHNQTAGTTINIPPLPPVVVVAPSDTTYSTPYSYGETQKTSYHKVSKSTMNANCPTAFEETINDNSVNITPGTSTLTITDSGKRKYTCVVE